jgi:hypothetical protein
MTPFSQTKSISDLYGILIFRKSPVPGFFSFTYPDTAMNNTTFVSLDAPGYDIAYNKAGGKDDKAFAGYYITANHTAYRYTGTADIALHSGFFTNDHTPLSFEIPVDIAVYPGKTSGFYIPPNIRPRTYYSID